MISITAEIKGELLAMRGVPGAIAESLGRRILNGDILPGEALPPEAAFLAQAGVSRSSLREAIKTLSAKGLVEARPKVGTRVLPRRCWSLLDPAVLRWQFAADDLAENIADLFEIRRIVEPEAAALAARRATSPAIAAIAVTLAAMKTSLGDGAKALEADIDFHLSVLQASGNRFLQPFGNAIETALRSTVKLSLARPGGLGHSLPQHAAVAAAIEARDEAAARTAMLALIEAAELDTRGVLARQGGRAS